MGNALANFHNARKARSPVVNIVGQHTSKHLRYESPLAADVEAFARPVSAYVRTLARPEDMGKEALAAIDAARRPPGQVATLIVPADFSWSEAGKPEIGRGQLSRPRYRCECVREAAEVLRSSEPVGVLLGGAALLSPGLKAAEHLAARPDTRVFADRFAARMECGAGNFAPMRIAYFPEDAEPMLAGLKHLILVEAQPPVSFFQYPGRGSDLEPEDCEIHVLASVEEDGTGALQALADECGSVRVPPPPPQASRPTLPQGANLTPDSIGLALAALMPDGSIVSDEMVSSGYAVMRNISSSTTDYDFLPVTGGSIGQGLPVAVGAALACPGRKVIALEADGSGMYTFQSLWTMAREKLDVITIILANRRYHILEIEMRRTGAGAIGPVANEMIEIGRPEINWVKLAEGVGVQATRATTADEFIAQFRSAVNQAGPSLIEAVIT